MRRLLVLVALAGMAMFCGIGATPSSADSCFKTLNETLLEGSFNDSACAAGGGTKAYTWAGHTFGWQKLVGFREYCATVKSTLASFWQDGTCTKEFESTSKFVKVVAEAGWIWGISPLKGTNSGKGAELFGTTAGKVSCAEETVSGEPTATSGEAFVAKVKYGKCEAFGSSATVSEAEYELTANGALSVVGKNIVVTDTETKCTVTIPAGGSNKGLETMKYTNTEAGDVVEKAAITGLNYEASGGVCGTAGKLQTNGTYEGETELSQEAGAVEVRLIGTEIPHLGLLSGEVSPVIGEGTAKGGAIKIETELGKIEATEAKLSIELRELGLLDTFSDRLTGVKEGKNPCKTAGEPKETVLLKGELRLVYLELAAEGKLVVGALLTPKETVVECEKVKVTIKGTMLAGLVPAAPNEFFKSLKHNVKCKAKAAPEFSKYFNEEATSVSTSLLVNFGLGFAKACANLGEESSLTLNKSALISG